MWDLISGLLKDPGRLKAGLEEMIEQERAGLRGDPDQEAKSWLAKLAEVDQERRGYLRLAAKGRLTDEELDEALAELEDARETAEKELRAVRARREVLENLERDRDALLESYANMTPAALDALSPEERHQIYKMLRITVEAYPDGSLNVTGVLGDSFVSELAPVLALAIFTTVSVSGFADWTATRGIYTRSDAEAALLGIRLRAATPPGTRIAVVAAGSTPYFAHRPAIDLLGKNDPVIARRAPHHSFHPGHDRFDYRYSLGELKPDVVVQLWYTTDEDWDFFKRAGYARLQGMLVRTDIDPVTVQRFTAALESVRVVPLF